MVPTPSSIVYRWNETDIRELELEMLEEVDLELQTETDYLFFSITPQLPASLSFDEATGRITGRLFEELAPTEFVVEAKSAASIVITTLTLSCARSALAAAGGEVRGAAVTVEVRAECVAPRSLTSSNRTICSAAVQSAGLVGCLVPDAYSVTLRGATYARSAAAL